MLCGDPASQVSDMLTYLEETESDYSTIWLDVEDPSAWGSDEGANMQFFNELVNAFTLNTSDIGMYTIYLLICAL